MMNYNQEVPSFLLEKISTCSSDQKRLLQNLQLWSLWQTVYGDKPYVHADAVKLQKRLAMQHVAHSRKEAEKRLKTQENDLKVLQSVRRTIAESCLRVEVFAEPNEISTTLGKIGFGDKIKDAQTGKTLGIVRQLLLDDHITWENCGNPFENLEEFIGKLRKWDGFRRPYTFIRPHRIDDYDVNYPHIVIEKSPFKPKIPKYVQFSLTLRWKPFSNSEIKKKLGKHLHRMTIPHV